MKLSQLLYFLTLTVTAAAATTTTRKRKTSLGSIESAADILPQVATQDTGLKTASSRDEDPGNSLARNKRSSKNATSGAETTQAPKKGWSKAADAIPFGLRSSPLGRSLITWFIASYSDREVDVDGNVEFSCKNKVTKDFASRDPRLRWRWVKDGDPVRLDNSRMLLTDFVLYIEEVRLSDAGTYECRMVLGDGTELTADLFTLTVLTSLPTLVVRETLPLGLHCHSEALAAFLHNFDLSLKSDQSERRKRAGETDKDSNSNSFKVMTTDPRFEKFLLLGKSGFRFPNNRGIGKVPKVAHEVLVKRQTKVNQTKSSSPPTIVRKWYFNGNQTKFFPKDIPVDQPSPEVVQETVPRMAGEWTCKVHHTTTRHTWRTARYVLRVAAPPSMMERLWRGVVARPWILAVVAVPLVVLLIGAGVVVARGIQRQNVAVDEKFEILKRKLLAKGLIKGDSSLDTKRQTLQSNITNPDDGSVTLGTSQAPQTVSDTPGEKSWLDKPRTGYHVRYFDDVKGIGGGSEGGKEEEGIGAREGGAEEEEEERIGAREGGAEEDEEDEEEDEENDETRRLITR